MGGLLAGLRDAWDSFLEKMARQNQKQFGNKRLDCCNIDKGGDLHHTVYCKLNRKTDTTKVS